VTVTKWVSATHPTISSSPRELFQRSAAASRRCILKSFWSRDREKWSRGQRSRPMASSPWLIPGERHMLHCSRPALRVGKVSVTYRWGQMDQERRRRPAGCSGWRWRGGGTVSSGSPGWWTQRWEVPPAEWGRGISPPVMLQNCTKGDERGGVDSKPLLLIVLIWTLTWGSLER